MYSTILCVNYEPIMFRKIIDNEENLDYKIKTHYADTDNDKFYMEITFSKITREQKDAIESEHNLHSIYRILQQLKS